MVCDPKIFAVQDRYLVTRPDRPCTWRTLHRLARTYPIVDRYLSVGCLLPNPAPHRRSKFIDEGTAELYGIIADYVASGYAHYKFGVEVAKHLRATTCVQSMSGTLNWLAILPHVYPELRPLVLKIHGLDGLDSVMVAKAVRLAISISKYRHRRTTYSEVYGITPANERQLFSRGYTCKHKEKIISNLKEGGELWDTSSVLW